MNEIGSDDEDEGLLSEDEGGEAGNGGSGGAGTGYDAFTAPPFAESWEAWEREEERNEQQEETVEAAFFEDNDGFDPGEPPLEPLHPWKMGQPALHVGSLTSALEEAARESEGTTAGGGKEDAVGEACNGSGGNNFSGVEALLEELSGKTAGPELGCVRTAGPEVEGDNPPSDEELGVDDEVEGVACLLALRRPLPSFKCGW
jgi:hypothetical protein